MKPPPSDAAQPGLPTPVGPVILFDGVCNLCSAAVLWVIAHDGGGVFRFASLQSRTGQAAIESAQTAHDSVPAAPQRPDSIVLIDSDGVHFRSGAALRIARRLGFPWSLAAAGVLVPRPVRDGFYDWVARHRYRWFGKQNACMAPAPELRARFLDADEPSAGLPLSPDLDWREGPFPPGGDAGIS